MTSTRGIELILRRDGERTVLCAPLVGRLQGASPKGAVLVAGQAAGWLLVLGRARQLIVPQGVEGRIVSTPPAELSAPVSYGEVLYQLEALEPGAAVAEAEAQAAHGNLCVRAPHAGRFWSRPAPDAPAYAAAGTVLTAGSALGLIEVMKTFGQVAYRPGGALPERAKVLRVLVTDGMEVDEGTDLVEIEPA